MFHLELVPIVLSCLYCFSCCVTSYRKCNSFKEHAFIISLFCESEVWHGLTGSSVFGSRKAATKVSVSYILTDKLSWVRICFQAHSDCDWIHFLAAAQQPASSKPAGVSKHSFRDFRLTKSGRPRIISLLISLNQLICNLNCIFKIPSSLPYKLN